MNVTMKQVTIVAALTMGTMLFPAANKAAAGGIPLLGTVYDTDFVSAGVGGMRNTPGFHDITLTGVSGQVTQALLYWHGPTNSLDPTANEFMLLLAPPTNIQIIVGTNIGFSSDNCWGFDNSQAYVADVTPFVKSTGNGDYMLFPIPPVNLNGASLIVFFDDPDPMNNRDVVVFDGNDSNVINTQFDAAGWGMTLSGISYTAGTANLQLHISDGEGLDDDALSINGNPKIPGGNWVTGFSVPGVNNGPTGNGRLWDIIDIDVTPDLGGAPPQTLAMSMTGTTCSNNIDGLSLVVAIIDLPAGAAPDQPVDCVVGFGFWMTRPGDWPVNELTLGTVTYTKTQLEGILLLSAGNNCLHKLAKHLIAAKLNQAAGATVPQAVQAAIAAADALIGMLEVPPTGNNDSVTAACGPWNAVKDVLDDYNNGLPSPGDPVSCDTVNNADFPSGPVSCNFAEGFVGPLFSCFDQNVNADLNNDGVTDCFDLLLLLAAWGPNPNHPADCDGNDNVGASDLLVLVFNWTGGPPPAGVENCLLQFGTGGVGVGEAEPVIACLEPDAAALRPPCCGGQ